MPARMLEALIGWGFRKQSDIATASDATDIWRLGKLNAELDTPKLNTENDAPELGKGHEFATQIFKTSWDLSGKLEKYLSSDFGAWAMAFSLGKVVKSGSTPNFIYTCTPANPASDGIELPYFSYVEQIRPGMSSVIDRIAVGCMIS